MKSTIVTIIVLFVSTFSFSQGEVRYWYFGNNAGLDFSTSPPTVLHDSKMTTYEGCASISDSTGKLLFYTDGIKLWDINHNIMPNGDGLFGDFSATQSAIIVKNPYSLSEYYVFTVDANSGTNGLCYSKVDMLLNGGKGDVTTKNVPLINDPAEKIAAVPHKNGKDFWVLTKERTSNRYYALLVNAGGVGIPITSNLGNCGGTSLYSGIGTMKVSYDFKKVAVADYYGGIEVLNFDNTTGNFSNAKSLYFTDKAEIYGVEFSPNSKMLYASFIAGTTQDEVWQFDISSDDENTIKASKQVVAVFPKSSLVATMQLASDGRIYLTRNNSTILSVINQPNKSGTSCNVILNYLDLSPGRCRLGLPVFYINYIQPVNIEAQQICFGDNTLMRVTPEESAKDYDSIKWIFDDIITGASNYAKGVAVSHVFSAKGKYLVKAILYTGTQIDTLKEEVEIISLPNFSLGADKLICSNDSVELIGPLGMKSYVWSTGMAGSSRLVVKTKGYYTLTVSNENCSAKDAVFVDVKPEPIVDVGSDVVLCNGDSTTIGKTIGGMLTYQWNPTGKVSSQIVVNSAAKYVITMFDGVCTITDTVAVGVYTPQTVDIGKDTTICEGTALEVDATVLGGKYLWNNASTDPKRTLTQAGFYKVTVIDSVCVSTDSITLEVDLLPPLDLGSDTALCQGETYALEIDPLWDKVEWADGNNQYNRVFTAGGNYEVTASFLHCKLTDDININYHPALPILNIGSDTAVCAKTYHILKSSYNGYYGIRWQDGSDNNTYTVSETGEYIISTKPHRCGQVSDTVHIRFLEELCNLYVPNAFSPNGDGVNDYFMPFTSGGEVLSMQIFNRWGELLYDDVNPWDGTYKGDKVPVGAYIYVVVYGESIGVAGVRKQITKGTLHVVK